MIRLFAKLLVFLVICGGGALAQSVAPVRTDQLDLRRGTGGAPELREIEPKPPPQPSITAPVPAPAQAGAPLIFGLLLDRMGLGVLAISAGLSLAAAVALLMLKAHPAQVPVLAD